MRFSTTATTVKAAITSHSDRGKQQVMTSSAMVTALSSRIILRGVIRPPPSQTRAVKPCSTMGRSCATQVTTPTALLERPRESISTAP